MTKEMNINILFKDGKLTKESREVLIEYSKKIGFLVDLMNINNEGYIINSSSGLIMRDKKNKDFWLGGGSSVVVPIYEKRSQAEYIVKKLKTDWKNKPFNPDWFEIKKVKRFD